MQVITSRDNPLYKELRLIATSSHARRKSGRVLLDGIHLCQAYIENVGVPLVCVASESAVNIPEVSVLLVQCKEASARCISLPEPLYKPLTQVENGVGILFLVERPIVETPERLTKSAVLLDQVQDPGNLGSIIRSAAAAGISQVFCSPGTAQAWSPRVLRAGMGAHFLLQIFENADLSELLKSSTVPVVATSPHQQQTIYDINLKQPIAWLFGHEGQGVSESLLSMATNTVAIPHLGEMESLNVAACAAVCLFEQVRQKERRTLSG